MATANRKDIFVYYALVITKFAATKITGAHSFERSSLSLSLSHTWRGTTVEHAERKLCCSPLLPFAAHRNELCKCKQAKRLSVFAELKEREMKGQRARGEWEEGRVATYFGGN